MSSAKIPHIQKLKLTVSTLLVLFFVLTLSLPTGVVSAAEKETIDGVLHVKNGSKPAQVETIQLEELWTAGGEDDEDVLFGILTNVKIDDQGNICLLDNQMSQVHVYSSDGELLNTLGRAGEGPGEVTNPSGMTLLENGSIGLVKTMPGTLVMIDNWHHSYFHRQCGPDSDTHLFHR